MVIIATSHEQGRCYVETKNLDGESNKKIRYTHRDMIELTHDKEPEDILNSV